MKSKKLQSACKFSGVCLLIFWLGSANAQWLDSIQAIPNPVTAGNRVAFLMNFLGSGNVYPIISSANFNLVPAAGAVPGHTPVVSKRVRTTNSGISSTPVTVRITAQYRGRTITVDLVVNPRRPSSAPTLTSPGNNATNYDGRPPFRWNTVARAAQYRLCVYVGNSNACRNNANAITRTVTARSYGGQLPNGLRGRVVRWHVHAINVSGEGPRSSRRNVRLTLPSATLVNPLNNATSSTRQPTFRWVQVPGASGYQIRVWRTNGSPWRFDINSGTTTSSTPPTPIFFGGPARWSVNAKSDAVPVYGQPSGGNQIRAITLPGGNSELTWTSPITTTNFPDLSIPSVTNQNVERPRIENQTIAEIISSQVIARGDDKKCTACHFQNSNISQFYRPTVGPSSTTSISRTGNYNYNNSRNGMSTWAVSNGFGDRFVQRHAGGTRANPQFGQKPTFLRKLIEKWIADGRKQ